MHSRPLIDYLLLSLVIGVFAIYAWVIIEHKSLPNFDVVHIQYPAVNQQPDIPTQPSSRFVSRGQTRFTHSAAVVELNNAGSLRAFWYGGTDERGKNVTIYSAVFNPAVQTWSAPKSIIDRSRTAKDTRRSIRTLGNPTVIKDTNGRLWLYYVSTSLGGWGTSGINVTYSDDEGNTWSRVRRLITSPTLNLSTLVKSTPVLLEEGGIGIPAYHELFGKFGEFLYLNQAGYVIYKTRLSTDRDAIQPYVVPVSSTKAYGFMRYAGQEPPFRVLALETSSAGRQWTQPRKLSLPNPNASVAALSLENGGLLLVFNNSEDNRSDLSLAYSRDQGQTWRVIHAFERKVLGVEQKHNKDYRYSYPSLLRTRNGDFHLLYTWNQSKIKHIQFNRAWLDKTIGDF